MRPMNRLRLQRLIQGTTQDELAQRLGMGQASLSRIENGTQGVSEAQARRIAEALGADPSWIFDAGRAK